MKLHLPLSLLFALSLCGHGVEGSQDTAGTDITTVDVHSAEDIAAHASESASYNVIQDVDASGVRTTGDWQVWVGNNVSSLTMRDNRSQEAGGAVHFQSWLSSQGDETTEFKEFTTLTFANNKVTRPKGPQEDDKFFHGGAIFGEDGSDLKIHDNGSVSFNGNVAESGGAIYVHSSCDSGGGIFGSVSITKNKNVTFADNVATNEHGFAGFGGALFNTKIAIENNQGGTITFQHNKAVDKGGAIYVHATGYAGVDYLHLNNNTSDILFTGNEAKYGGGAICALKDDDTGHKASVDILDNSKVVFESNKTDSGSGSAIWADKLNMNHNDIVQFHGNVADSGAAGGAVCAEILSLSDNGSLSFSENKGGGDGLAVYTKNLTMNGNKSVLFDQNSHVNAAFALGALYVDGTAKVQGNKAVTFSGNTSSHDCAGFVSVGSLDLTGNGRVTFTGNVGRGRAGGLYVEEHTDAVIANNEHLEFSGNIVNDKQTGQRYLRGLYVNGRGEHRTYFAASEGYDITINDSAVFNDCAELYLNAVKKDGTLEATTGTIVFSGKDSLGDLGLYTDWTFTERELQLSRTSSINRSTALYGGTLSVQDEAILALNGLNVRSGATLDMKNGAIQNSVSGELDRSFLTLEGGSTLILSESNRMKAKTVTLEEGSTMKFFLETRQEDKPMLTMDAELVQGGTSTIHLLHADGVEDTCLITMASGAMPAGWDFSRISLKVGDDNQDNMHLYWHDGSLYYSRDTILGWTGEQSNVWANNSDANWAYSSSPDVSRAYRDNAALYIANVSYDSIELQGDLTPAAVSVNVAKGKELTLTGEGRLVGGAALQVAGGGTLVVDTANANTGDTDVTTTTLRVTKDGSLGSGSVKLHGATLEVDSADCQVGQMEMDMSTVVLGKDAALRVSAPISVLGTENSMTGSAEGGSHIIADALKLTRKSGTGTPWMEDCTHTKQYASTGSGFTVNPDTIATVKVFNLAEGAALDLRDVTVTHYAAPVDAVFTYDAATGEFSTGIYTSTAWNRYIIRQDHNDAYMNYAAILDASCGDRQEAQLQEVSFQANDTTLLVNRSVDKTMVLVAAEGVTATLNTSDDTQMFASSLTGAGAYVVAGGASEFITEGWSTLPASVSLDSSWKGKLVMTGDGSASALQMEKLHSDASTLVFQGYTASLGNKGEETSLSVPVELRAGEQGEPALVIAACNEGSTYTWKGPVYGAGDIVNRAENDLSMAFGEDVAHWTGAFVQEGAGTASLDFTQAPNVNISLAADAGRTEVKLGDETKLAAPSIHVFDGAEIAITGGQEKTVEALTMGAGRLSVTESDISGNEQPGLLSVTGSLTAGSGTEIYSRLSLVDGAMLDLQTLDGVSLDYGTLELHEGLVLGADAVHWLNILKDGGEFTLFTNVDELILPGEELALLEPYTVEAANVFGNIRPGYFELVYSGSPSYINVDNAVAGTVYLRKNTPSVPEPATGTLSLLALAALAARRRRK